MNTLLRCAMTVAAIGLSVGRVNADTVTWVGPASGGNWSESANWQDGAGAARAPGTDDIATFPATTTDVTLDAATAVKGVKIVAAFTLNGTEKLTLGADGIDTASSSTATVTVYVPLELSSGDVKFNTSTSASGNLYLEGVISGSGRLYQYGMGPVHLKCANTFTGGVRSCGTGSANSITIRVYEDTSLGGPDADGNYGTVTMESMNLKYGGIRIMKNMTIANPFRTMSGGTELIYFASDVKTANTSVNNGEVVFTAPFTLNNGLSFQADSGNTLRVRFLKPFRSMSTGGLSMYMQNNDSSSLHFEGGLFLGKGGFSADGHGKLCLYACDEPNTWAYASCTSPCICCYGTNVLPTTSGSYIEVFSYQAGLDLRGYSQKVPRFRSKNSAVNTSHYLKSSTGGTPVLEVTEGGDDMFGGLVQNAVTFCWNPSSAKTMTFKTQTSTTTGDLIVSNGTLRLEGAKFPNIGKVVVGPGATFSVDTAAKIGTATPLLVDEAGFVQLDTDAVLSIVGGKIGETELVPGKSYAGVQAAGVEYLPQIKGAGRLFVARSAPATSATWTGGAGDDTLMSTGANWEGGEKPDLVGGGLLAKIVGGTCATLPGDIALRGLDFCPANGLFSVTDGGANRTLTLLADGITTTRAEGFEGTATNIIDAAVFAEAAQTWTAGANTRLVFNKGFSAVGSTSFTTKGPGTIELKGENDFLGDFTLASGKLVVHGDKPFGTSSGGKLCTKSAGVLYMNNAKIYRTVETSGSTGYDAANEIVAVKGTTNYIYGLVTRSSGNLHVGGEGRLVLAGGGSGNWFQPRTSGKGEVVITNKPLTCSAYSISQDSTTRFQVAGNTCSMGIGNGCNSTVHLETDDVFSNRKNLSCTSGGSVYIYLHGTTQKFGDLVATYNGSHVTSSEPGAVLDTVPTSDNTDCRWRIEGKVSLKKGGAYVLRFTKPCPATGTLSVSEGTLGIGTGCQWANATNIVVTGTGTLATEADNAFSKDCDITLDGADARLSLGFTGTAVCNRLFMRNAQGKLHPVPAGIYGALDNPNAPNKLANITGTGLLKVTQPRGLLLFVM